MRTAYEIWAGRTPEPPPLQTLHGLRESHVEAANATLARTGGRWSVERHIDYNGDLSVLLFPKSKSAATLAFVIHRDRQGIHLAATEDDDYHKLGTFLTIQAAIQRLRQHLDWKLTHYAS